MKKILYSTSSLVIALFFGGMIAHAQSYSYPNNYQNSSQPGEMTLDGVITSATDNTFVLNTAQGQIPAFVSQYTQVVDQNRFALDAASSLRIGSRVQVSGVWTGSGMQVVTILLLSAPMAQSPIIFPVFIDYSLDWPVFMQRYPRHWNRWQSQWSEHRRRGDWGSHRGQQGGHNNWSQGNNQWQRGNEWRGGRRGDSRSLWEQRDWQNNNRGRNGPRGNIMSTPTGHQSQWSVGTYTQGDFRGYGRG
ncbi:MAG: hypothetical protein Q7S47_01980 [bacterium]|nr:hypothetical protein [bacterium]